MPRYHPGGDRATTGRETASTAVGLTAHRARATKNPPGVSRGAEGVGVGGGSIPRHFA